MKRLLQILTFILFFCFIAQFAAAPVISKANDEVKFPNKELETVIRNKLKKPTGSITKKDVLKIEELLLGTSLGGPVNKNKVKYSVEGLQYLTNLKSLSLSDTYQLESLSPIKNLKRLEYLSLEDSNCRDIRLLAGLTNLYHLNISGCGVEDISVLSNLKGLQTIYMNNNKIKDLSPISNLPYLEDINASKNKITDISPIGKLKNLTHIDFSENQISDISLLNKFKRLIFLDVSSNKISDITTLSSLENLELLAIDHNSITGISTLKKLKFLKNLYISNNNISNIDVVANFPDLVALSFDGNRVQNIGVLSKLKNLKILDLKDNPISDFSAITPYYHKLEYVDYSFTEHDSLEQAKEQIKQGYLEEALKNIDTILNKYPNYTEAVFKKGYVLMLQQKYTEAVNVFKKCIQLDNEHYIAYNNLAWGLFELGKYAEALPYAEKCTLNLPDYNGGLDTKAWILYKLGKYNDAIALFNKVIKSFNNENRSTSSYIGAGCVYLELGNQEKAKNPGIKISKYTLSAKDSLNKALEIDSNNPQALYYLACAYSIMNDPKNASYNLKKAISIDSSYKQIGAKDKNLKTLLENPTYKDILQ